MVLWLSPELVPEPSAQIAGHVVTANAIQLIQDRSGSMGGREATVQERLAALRDGGIDSDRACVLGGSEFVDFVRCLEQITDEGEADGVYVFADFSWSYSETGLRTTERLVDERPVRLYLETIGAAPHPVLQRLANDSGGGVIGPRQ